MEKNKYIKTYSVLIFVFILLLVVFLCVCSMFVSVGYNQTSAAASLKNGNDIIFVIDPGHGGEDPGCVSGEYVEKTLNLDISLKLKSFLEISSCATVLTRETDRLLYNSGEENRKKFYDLKNRLDIAESYENGVYVGIHINKFSMTEYKGLQTFYSDNNSESLRIAAIIQENARLLDSSNKRQIKPDDNNIYILEKIQNPGVLVECGFISNEDEAQKLSDNEYRKKVAFIIYCSLEIWVSDIDTQK